MRTTTSVANKGKFSLTKSKKRRIKSKISLAILQFFHFFHTDFSTQIWTRSFVILNFAAESEQSDQKPGYSSLRPCRWF